MYVITLWYPDLLCNQFSWMNKDIKRTEWINFSIKIYFLLNMGNLRIPEGGTATPWTVSLLFLLLWVRNGVVTDCFYSTSYRFVWTPRLTPSPVTLFMLIFLNMEVLHQNFISSLWIPVFSQICLPVTPSASPISDSSRITCYQTTKTPVSGTSFLLAKSVSDQLLVRSRGFTAWGPPNAYLNSVSPPITVDVSEIPHSKAFPAAARASGMTKPAMQREWPHHGTNFYQRETGYKKELRGCSLFFFIPVTCSKADFAIACLE